MPAHDEPHLHLLCAVGTSPAVVTETLFALAVRPEGRAPAIVDGLTLITTSIGRDRVLKGVSDALRAMANDYPQAAHRFPHALPDDAILVPRLHDNAELTDVATPAESSAMGAALLLTVRRLTTPGAVPLHASVAGGRKTMGSYLGQAMSLFGRPCDTMSHVLATPSVETCREFYFPPANPTTLTTFSGHPFDASAERINLYDIPFVRVRLAIGELPDTTDLPHLFAAAQSALDPHVIIDLAARTVSVGPAPLDLSPHPGTLFLLLLLARRLNFSPERAHFTDATHPVGLLKSALYEHFFERNAEHLKTSFDDPYGNILDRNLSELRTRLRRKLAASLHHLLVPRSARTHGYQLAIAPEHIELRGLDTSPATRDATWRDLLNQLAPNL